MIMYQNIIDLISQFAKLSPFNSLVVMYLRMRLCETTSTWFACSVRHIYFIFSKAFIALSKHRLEFSRGLGNISFKIGIYL